jgi:predicted XRE-type DNA-binding protein
MASQQEDEVTMSSGNVFADLGGAEPEGELAKAQLASHIRQTIKHRCLTQAAAAALMGVNQPKVSALINGRLSGFSSDRLLRYLAALGGYRLRSTPSKTGWGHLRVIDIRLESKRDSYA